MNALLAIFDYYKCHSNKGKNDTASQTLKFLSGKSPNYPQLSKHIFEISDFLSQLRKNAPFSLSNDGVDIDFLALDQAIKNQKIKRYYNHCTEIRTELLQVSTKEDFEIFKSLNEYWQTLELSFRNMTKGPH